MTGLMGRLIAFMVGGILLLPLIVAGDSRALFIPSAEWQAWSLKVWAIATAASLIGVGVLHWLWVERNRPPDVEARSKLVLLRLLTGLVVIVLPVWMLGVVHGIVRGLVDRPVLEQLTLNASYDSYHSRRARRHVTAYVLVRDPEHGTIRIVVPEMAAEDLPEKGSAVTVLGRRTWVGDRYDRMALPLVR